jgi:hypothetical protein
MLNAYLQPYGEQNTKQHHCHEKGKWLMAYAASACGRGGKKQLTTTFTYILHQMLKSGNLNIL